MRQRLVRFDHEGGTHPDRFKDKHYLSLTNCYASPIENWVTGVTDQAFRTIDKVMSAAGVIKIHELVLTNTWGLEALPEAKARECQKWGNRLNTKIKKDDSTMKRYIQLFFYGCSDGFIDHGHSSGLPFNADNRILASLCVVCLHLLRLVGRYFAFLYGREAS